ncbi:MAG: class I SAM-dependent methyltransferase [Nitrospirae bacterium]|nr:MAG: class I SAM-dependent methyltransferase [Nitrospirota bacterium]
MRHIKRWRQHSGTIIDTVNAFDVIECDTCGFRHIVPIPSSDEIEQVYREDYYTVEKPRYLAEHHEDLEWWNAVYDERYDLLETWLPLPRRRLLDVGSGPGFFLLRGKQRGWETVGIEPSTQAARHSRDLGLEIIQGFLDSTICETVGLFDVVHMHEVLEHLPDPRHILRLTHRLLKPGGIVCIIVPNDYNSLQQVVRSQLHVVPWWIAPPHHINYFSHRSLQRLLESTGFQVVYTSSTFPIELFLLMGCNYIGNPVIGREVHARRKAMELHLVRAGYLALKKKIYEVFAQEGIGREVVVYAQV